MKISVSLINTQWSSTVGWTTENRTLGPEGKVEEPAHLIEENDTFFKTCICICKNFGTLGKDQIYDLWA